MVGSRTLRKAVVTAIRPTLPRQPATFFQARRRALAGMMRRMDITRRDALTSLAVFAQALAVSHDAAAQTAPAAPAPPVFVQALPNVNLEGWDVTVSHVEFPPGRVGTVHHHAGFVLAYVLQGSIVN